MTDATAARTGRGRTTSLARAGPTDAPPQRGREAVQDLRHRRRIGSACWRLSCCWPRSCRTALSAFRQTYLTIDVPLPADVLDPQGNRDPAEMAKVTTFGYAPADRRGAARR